MRTLVVVAVEAERAAVVRGAPHAQVLVSGVGPVAAAVATSRGLAQESTYDRVLNLGVAGAFEPGAMTLIGTAAVAADLGAQTAEGIRDLEAMGFGTVRHAADATVLDALRERLPAARIGELLTVWTVTGTVEDARRLQARHPDAIGEAMEGYGVAAAAAATGVPFGELRTVSNLVGPRSAWDLDGAFDELSRAAAAVLA